MSSCPLCHRHPVNLSPRNQVTWGCCGAKWAGSGLPCCSSETHFSQAKLFATDLLAFRLPEVLLLCLLSHFLCLWDYAFKRSLPLLMFLWHFGRETLYTLRSFLLSEGKASILPQQWIHSTNCFKWKPPYLGQKMRTFAFTANQAIKFINFFHGRLATHNQKE